MWKGKAEKKALGKATGKERTDGNPGSEMSKKEVQEEWEFLKGVEAQSLTIPTRMKGTLKPRLALEVAFRPTCMNLPVSPVPALLVD